MKSIADQILDEFKNGEGDVSFLPFKKEDVAKAFEQKLDKFDFDGVRVDSVEIDLEGDITVTFEDVEGDELSIIFQVDEEEDSVNAIIVDDEEEGEDDEVLMVDLTALAPTVIEVDALGVRYVNLTDLNWLNKSTMTSLLQAGDIGIPSPGIAPAQKKQDAFGNTTAPVDMGALESNLLDSLAERTMDVIRGGKKVRLPVIRRRRKKRLSSKQRMGLRKAAMKRKAKKSQIQRKRKRSLQLRKRVGLKRAKSGERKKFKVKG